MNELLPCSVRAVLFEDAPLGLHPVALVVLAQGGVVHFVILVKVGQQVLLDGGVARYAPGNVRVEDFLAGGLPDELVGDEGESRLQLFGDGAAEGAEVPAADRHRDFGEEAERLRGFVRSCGAGKPRPKEVVEEVAAQVVCAARLRERVLEPPPHGGVDSDGDALCSVLVHISKKKLCLRRYTPFSPKSSKTKPLFYLSYCLLIL